MENIVCLMVSFIFSLSCVVFAALYLLKNLERRFEASETAVRGLTELVKEHEKEINILKSAVNDMEANAEDIKEHVKEEELAQKSFLEGFENIMNYTGGIAKRSDGA